MDTKGIGLMEMEDACIHNDLEAIPQKYINLVAATLKKEKSSQ